MTGPRETRPRRSVLFMPGSNLRAMHKARSLPADVLVFDLEDAVSADQKSNARKQVADVLAEGGFGRRERVVRVNAMDTPWGHADLEAAASMNTDAVLLPKTASVDHVHAAAAILEAAGGADKRIWIMVETPAGVMNAGPLAASSSRLDCLVAGTSDLSKELRLPPDDDRTGLLAPLSWCVMAARAAGLDVLDGVHLEIRDSAGFQSACRQGRLLGFDGKTLIHPDQIAVANEIFSPAEATLERARRIIDAWEQATREGKGITVVDGRLVENLHVDEARRTLKLQKEIEELSQSQASQTPDPAR